MQNFFDLIMQALEEKNSFALGLISGIKGSSPQKQGAKALFFSDGKILGTMGGGCLEAEIQDRARRSLLTGQPARFDLVLDHDFGWDDGLICGGKVSGVILPGAEQADELWRRLAVRTESLTWGIRKDYSIGLVEGLAEDWIYQETVDPPFPLWIAGSGHVAQAVAALAGKLDFEVTVFDDRPALANHHYFPKDTRFRVDYWEKLLRDEGPSKPTFGIVVTRGHQHDALVLRQWIGHSFAFLGMIGSQRKKRIIFEKFVEEGFATEDQLSRVACPVGLDIGAVSVDEIAVSIMAQLVEIRAERKRATTESKALESSS